jgi:hypothetical protein
VKYSHSGQKKNKQKDDRATAICQGHDVSPFLLRQLSFSGSPPSLSLHTSQSARNWIWIRRMPTPQRCIKRILDIAHAASA